MLGLLLCSHRLHDLRLALAPVLLFPFEREHLAARTQPLEEAGPLYLVLAVLKDRFAGNGGRNASHVADSSNRLG